MDKYKNKEYLKYMLLGQSRHQFIYGYNNEKRKSFLKELDMEFPIKTDCNSPMAVYLSEFGLPKISIDNLELDMSKIDILSREYLSFSIAHAILLKSKQNISVDLLNSRIDRLLNVINKYSINSGYEGISDFEDLVTVLEQSKEFYHIYYMDYVTSGKEEKSIEDIVLPFLQLELFISHYKKALNNDSYFGIIVDRQHDIALSSTKSINTLVNARINKDISMKVVVEPSMWDSYIDSNGQYIESVHDYEIIELDDSQTEYMKKLKNNR